MSQSPKIDSYKNKLWKVDGKLHREDGPAIERADGSKEWYIEGKLHREDGAAIEWTNGSKYWYIDGNLHREDGAAIEQADGSKYWYIDGKSLTEQEFNKKMNKEKDKLMKKTGHKVKELAEFSIKKENELMKEVIAEAHNYITSESLKEMEALRNELRGRTETNRAMLKAIRDGVKTPVKQKDISMRCGIKTSILFAVGFLGAVVGMLVMFLLSI